MKFSCGRCGKKYATAETPAPGRVYKIKCKACGHLIVVKASGAPQQPAAAEPRPAPGGDPAAQAAPTPTPTPTDPHGVTLEIAAPEPHEPSEPDAAPGLLDGMPARTPPPLPLPVAAAAPSPADPPQQPPAPADHPAPPQEGYVDLFASDPKTDEHEKPADDPFLAAARASLPDGYGSSPQAPDPFAPLGPGPAKPAAPPPAPKVPVIAKPPRQGKSSAPIILIAVGALVLIGILAFVLLRGQRTPAAPLPAPPQASAAPPAPAPVPPAAQEPAPVAPTPAAPADAPAAAPAAPVPAPAAPTPAASPEKEKRLSAAERRARDRLAKEQQAREERDARERERLAKERQAREERDARERDRLAKEQQAREERDARERERIAQEQERVAVASAGEPIPESLTQDQVQKVLSANRRSFEACIGAAAKGGIDLDGRRVMLRLNIQQAGTVAYPTLDDVTLNSTDLGACLKSAARVMVFPKFRGDPMHVEVPLVLAPPRQ